MQFEGSGQSRTRQPQSMPSLAHRDSVGFSEFEEWMAPAITATLAAGFVLSTLTAKNNFARAGGMLLFGGFLAAHIATDNMYPRIITEMNPTCKGALTALFGADDRRFVKDKEGREVDSQIWCGCKSQGKVHVRRTWCGQRPPVPQAPESWELPIPASLLEKDASGAFKPVVDLQYAGHMTRVHLKEPEGLADFFS